MRGGTVFGDVDLLDVPKRMRVLGRPVESLGTDVEPVGEHVGVGAGRGDDGVALGGAVGGGVGGGVDVEAGEVHGGGDDLELVGGEAGSVGAELAEVLVGVDAFLDDGEEAALSSR